MTIQDIADEKRVIIITVPNTKTHIPRTFTLVNDDNEEINFLETFRNNIMENVENSQKSNVPDITFNNCHLNK